MMRDGVEGAGEPISVGGLVGIEGIVAINARVWEFGFESESESESDALSCRLLLGWVWDVCLRSMSSRALFLIFNMFGSSEA